MNPYYDRAKPHHRPEGFQNNYTEAATRGLAEVLRWKLNAARQGLPPKPTTPIPIVAPDIALLQRNAKAGALMQPSVTWIGHATVLAQLGGLTMLTDPIFSSRASPLAMAGPKRHHPPGVALKDLPHVDLVVASHNHYDHLDAASVKTLNRQEGGPPLFVVPLGLKPWLAAQGITHAVELDWWDSHIVPAPLGDVEVMLVPAQHWSARGLNDRQATLWGGFAVMAPDCHLFYAGDTGYSRDFSDIQAKLAGRQGEDKGGGFDIALLPIGAYEPRWFMSTQHVNVEEAVKIHFDLRAKRSLGVHWGTFELTDEALDEPPRVLAEIREARNMREDDFFVLAIGETRMIAPRVRAGASSPVHDPWLTRWLPLIAGHAANKPILEIGCGGGRDSVVLAGQGHAIVGIDLSEDAIARARSRVPTAQFHRQDLRAPFPIAGEIGVVIASLSLHYFSWEETEDLVARIHAHLRPGGVLLCRFNSTNDIHYGATGHPLIAENFYMVDGEAKRFFDKASIEKLFAKGWRILAMEEQTVDRYEKPKSLWEVILERAD